MIPGILVIRPSTSWYFLSFYNALFLRLPLSLCGHWWYESGRKSTIFSHIDSQNCCHAAVILQNVLRIIIPGKAEIHGGEHALADTAMAGGKGMAYQAGGIQSRKSQIGDAVFSRISIPPICRMFHTCLIFRCHITSFANPCFLLHLCPLLFCFRFFLVFFFNTHTYQLSHHIQAADFSFSSPKCVLLRQSQQNASRIQVI